MIKIIAIGLKMPEWIESGIWHYQKQLKKLTIVSIKNSNKNIESEKLLEKSTGFMVALDETGKNFTSVDLAKKIEIWQMIGDISFIIGGADGLNNKVRQKADLIMSLSKLTLPHSLVRLLLVEQLYRVNSIFNNHPYHRA